MVKINKIYTRTGDDGTTGLVGKARSPKDSPRVEAYGDVDELNSYLGWARTIAEKNKRSRLAEILAILQNQLFDLGSLLATSPGESWQGMPTFDDKIISQLEGWIDELMEGIPELRSFVLPGGTELNSIFHVSRCVCRRAERRILTLSRQEKVPPSHLVYVNRLSDLLFAMARKESQLSGTPEYLWELGKK